MIRIISILFSVSGFFICPNLFASNPLLMPQSVIGANDLEAIDLVLGTDYYEPSRAVARMEAGGGGYCTGFRVAPDLFMTNQHCSTFKTCDAVRFHLGFETALPAEKQIYFRCVAVETVFLGLDFALYRVERIASDVPDDFPILTLARYIPKNFTPLFFPAHPATGPKKIDRSAACQIMEAVPFPFYERTNIAHSCDSMSGSSGGPLISSETKSVVALHWGGVSTDSPKPYNHGIPMKAVLDYIEIHAPAAFSKLTIENEAP